MLGIDIFFMSSGVFCVVLAVGLDVSDSVVSVIVSCIVVPNAVSSSDNLEVEAVAISI